MDLRSESSAVENIAASQMNLVFFYGHNKSVAFSAISFLFHGHCDRNHLQLLYNRYLLDRILCAIVNIIYKQNITKLVYSI